jgi:hypothetical protein
MIETSKLLALARRIQGPPLALARLARDLAADGRAAPSSPKRRGNSCAKVAA